VGDGGIMAMLALVVNRTSVRLNSTDSQELIYTSKLFLRISTKTGGVYRDAVEKHISPVPRVQSRGFQNLPKRLLGVTGLRGVTTATHEASRERISRNTLLTQDPNQEKGKAVQRGDCRIGHKVSEIFSN